MAVVGRAVGRAALVSSDATLGSLAARVDAGRR